VDKSVDNPVDILWKNCGQKQGKRDVNKAKGMLNKAKGMLTFYFPSPS
jgi:hypothetical protein